MKTPFISIIIPVYNVDNYLSTCIDSVLYQTFDNWELILVNDGSPDNSGTICDQYSSKDKRIRTFHKSNGGVSSARNLGINKAQGEWLYFIDSDDFIEKETLSVLVERLHKNSADLIVHGLVNDYVDKRILKPYTDKKIDNRSIQSLIEFTDKGGLLRGPVCKLYLRYIVDKYKIRFDESFSYGEDTKFTFEYLKNCNSIIFINEMFYHYCFRENESLSKKDYSYISWNRIANMLLEVRMPIMRHFSMPDSYYQYIRFQYIQHLSHSINSMYRRGIGRNERIHYLKMLKKDKHLQSPHNDLFYLNRFIYLLKYPILLDLLMKFFVKFNIKVF